MKTQQDIHDDKNHAILYDIVAQHNESLIRMEQSITNMVNTIQGQEERNAACRERLMDMVPEGDFDGHRRYHEAIIKKMEAKAKWWQDFSASIAKWGAIAVLGWMAVAMWHEAVAAIRVLLVK